jgi:GcrA cell cycle regulator
VATSWTEDRIEALKQYLTDGLTSGTIRRMLNALPGKPLTRNAVIGKIHRDKLEWTGRADRLPHFAPLVRRAPLRLVLPVPMPQCQLVDLNTATCRWPTGTPGCADFFFCGEQTSEMSPYCERHHRMAFRSLPQSASDILRLGR